MLQILFLLYYRDCLQLNLNSLLPSFGAFGRLETLNCGSRYQIRTLQSLNEPNTCYKGGELLIIGRISLDMILFMTIQALLVKKGMVMLDGGNPREEGLSATLMSLSRIPATR